MCTWNSWVLLYIQVNCLYCGVNFPQTPMLQVVYVLCYSLLIVPCAFLKDKIKLKKNYKMKSYKSA